MGRLITSRRRRNAAAGEEEYELLLLDIQSWSLGCIERDKTYKQFGDEEENLAHMELDNVIMNLSTMRWTQRMKEYVGGRGTASISARLVLSGDAGEAPPLFRKEGLPKSMPLGSESHWLTVPIWVNPGRDWPGEDSYSIPGSSSMLEEEGMEVGGDDGAHQARSKRKKSTIHLSTLINIP